MIGKQYSDIINARIKLLLKYNVSPNSIARIEKYSVR
jgi:hypothetical protein